jgi:dynein heavy chain
MLPTPAKFHYIFNLRDLSRIWQGMLNTISDIITDERSLMLLWKHECHRVIADRFTNEQDKEWFEKSLVKLVGEEFDEERYEHVQETPYFVDFLRFLSLHSRYIVVVTRSIHYSVCLGFLLS